MQLARTELRTATDAAARAGAKELSLTQSETAARAKAKDAAKRNWWPASRWCWRTPTSRSASRCRSAPAGSSSPTAARSRTPCACTGKRTSGSKSGPVDLMFAGVLGRRRLSSRSKSPTSTQLDRDICLVVDRSGSMMWTLTGDNYPKGTKECDKPHPTQSRWGALATAVEAFLTSSTTTVQDEHVAHGELFEQHHGMRQHVQDFADRFGPGERLFDDSHARWTNLSSKPVKGSTAISAGIDDGIKVLTGAKIRPFAVKTMILMTDGIHNLGTGAGPVGQRSPPRRTS